MSDRTHRVLVRYAGGGSISLTVLADTPREAARKILLDVPKAAARRHASEEARRFKMARITGVTECWQRDLAVRGEHIQAGSIQSACDALVGQEGTLAKLKELALPWADKCLVTVDIRLPNGNLHVVKPARW